MAGSPKDTELKLQKMLNGWETLAPDKSFAGMTLQQFKTAAQPAQAARQRLEEIEDQQKQAIAQRDAADAALQSKMQQVIAGVLADPTEGPDSALYESMGYTRKSERKTGLTRKRNKPPTT
ncbi:MAG TPA: hypothetical protein VN256_12000 [Pyrinomonadaceae bacterium]|nr:hypothetical protein [Pyrinomonadaceae bacterium]